MFGSSIGLWKQENFWFHFLFRLFFILLDSQSEILKVEIFQTSILTFEKGENWISCLNNRQECLQINVKQASSLDSDCFLQAFLENDDTHLVLWPNTCYPTSILKAIQEASAVGFDFTSIIAWNSDLQQCQKAKSQECHWTRRKQIVLSMKFNLISAQFWRLKLLTLALIVNTTVPRMKINETPSSKNNDE